MTSLHHLASCITELRRVDRKDSMDAWREKRKEIVRLLEKARPLAGIAATRDGDNFVVTMPAGKYVLGDPGYTVPDAIWTDIIDVINDTGVGFAMWKDTPYHILGFNTGGDGMMTETTTGKELGVDAGLMGLVPYDLAVQGGFLSDDKRGMVVVFDTPTVCYNNSIKTLHFGDFHVTQQ
jgi:hypothetical protein